MAFILAPLPARILADYLGWRAIPSEERPPFKVGAIFDRAFAKRQISFIRTLAEQDGDPSRDLSTVNVSEPAASSATDLGSGALSISGPS